MSSPPTLLLVHLGNGTPPYLLDCVHQLRLFNPQGTLRIILIIDPVHRDTPFVEQLAPYDVSLRYTDTLPTTSEHETFVANYQGDTEFRNGYWQFVKRRFFYMEEIMRAEALDRVIAMEYDILLYTSVSWLLSKLVAYTTRLAMVKDNEVRNHPGFLFIPSIQAIHQFNVYMVEMMKTPYEDMQLLCQYANTYPERVSFLPVISKERNDTIPIRESLDGEHLVESPSFLSEGFDELGVLFDSAVIGQYVAGIDSRNLNGMIIPSYENEGALYNIREMEFGWVRVADRWIPVLDHHPLVTIHMHSKFLKSFLSDKPTAPTVETSELNGMLEGWPWY